VRELRFTVLLALFARSRLGNEIPSSSILYLAEVVTVQGLQHIDATCLPTLCRLVGWSRHYTCSRLARQSAEMYMTAIQH
jgi:hypothetical protein